jgi:hypothetical protein
MTILRYIFIFSVVEMSKNSPKEKNFENVYNYLQDLMFASSSTMVKLHLKHHNHHRQYYSLKNKMHNIHKINIFKNDDNIFTFDRTKMTILKSIFIFSVVEMSKNSPKQNNFENV